MHNMLDSGLGWITKQLRQNASTPAIYRRGTSAVAVDLTRGRSEYTTHDDMGNLVTKVTDATFICDREKLVLEGKVTDPVEGDRIVIKGGTQTLTYEVMRRGNKKAFSVDANRKLLRIRTKLILTQ